MGFGQNTALNSTAPNTPQFGASNSSNNISNNTGNLSLFGKSATPTTSLFSSSAQNGNQATGQQSNFFGSGFQSPQQQPQQQQQHHTNTPAFGASAFGNSRSTGGLMHSQSLFDIRSSMTPQQQLQQQQMANVSQQFQSQGQQQLQQQQQSTAAYLTSSPTRHAPETPSWATMGDHSRRYVQSHLAHMRFRNSPGPDSQGSLYLGGGSSLSGMPMSPGTPSAVPSPRTAGTPLSATKGSYGRKYGGQSFGTPKPHNLRSNHPSVGTGSAQQQQTAASLLGGDFADDLPPTESIYDSSTASPFAFQVPTAAGTASTSMSGLRTGSISVTSPSAASGGTLPDVIAEASSPSAGNSGPKSLFPPDYVPTSVIVFGFPAEITHVVVDHFARFGKIMEHLSTSSEVQARQQEKALANSGVSNSDTGPAPVVTGKNWLKLTYTTSTAANRALLENGRVLGGQDDFVIGCIPFAGSGFATENGLSPSKMYFQSPANDGNSGRGMRRSTKSTGASLDIHGLLTTDGVTNGSEAGNNSGGREDPSTPAGRSSYVSTISRRRAAGGGARGEPVSHLFTPVSGGGSNESGEGDDRRPGVNKIVNAGGLPRTISMPVGLATVTSSVRGAEGIFKEKERKGNGILPQSLSLRGLSSLFVGGGGGEEGGVAQVGAGPDSHRGPVGGRGAGGGMWGSLSRRATEMIFGWDDL
ncbi:Nup53/35/40-type RNA recognition motif-domain-containing protein [Lipomyces oligophaga]|uniref:Nup53/35/40-type RNA recognition motif-domain-containing protein n=1 Tax=Lipomyces oligophaga TaxID=45792 RepID=UPI0034CF0E2A